MDKTVLEQYVELKEESKDLHNRIDRDRRRLVKIENEGVVSDTVKGTRKDGTIGPIKITGYPFPEVDQVKGMIKKRVAKLHILEDELQDALNAADDFIREIPQSDLRMMFRFYYLDGVLLLNDNSYLPKIEITVFFKSVLEESKNFTDRQFLKEVLDNV